jgi:hypothetical protein
MNRPLPPGDCGSREADPSWTSGLAGPMLGPRRLVRRIAIDRGSKETTHGFIGIKHGGFARFRCETPCALAPGARKEGRVVICS